MTNTKSTKEPLFTKYQAFIIAILAIVQFTVILDFMVLSPLGAQLMEELKISTSQFGWVVSAYAFSAGGAGIIAAGFADRFDRKKLLLFFYTGFIFGTLLCAIAPSYQFLLMARIVTGLFGGVLGSVSFAIITDLFKLEVRGRVMGFVQMAFAASQILGIPVGLVLANNFGWHSPFWMIVVFSILVCVSLIMYMKPIDAHLELKNERNAFQHLAKTISNTTHIRAFLATVLLATGGFMLMPFGSAFSIHNLGLTMKQLPILYGITGVSSILFGPLLGKLADRIGKFNLFFIGTAISMAMVAIYTHLQITPLWVVTALNIILFVGISSRMISSSALISAIPQPQDRGAFMAINSAIQQLSGGVAAALAGIIVVKTESGYLEHYPELGYVVMVSMVIALVMMYVVDRHVKKNRKSIIDADLSS
jgi:predicted MFS family arabinose efflux permease